MRSDTPRAQHDAKAAAGLGSENPHVEIRATLAFKREWLKAKGVSPKSLAVIYADGESMEPTINDGDVLPLIYLRLSLKTIRSSCSPDLRRHRQETGFIPLGRWIIRSDNEDKAEFPDRNLSREDNDEHRIIGKVIWRVGICSYGQIVGR